MKTLRFTMETAAVLIGASPVIRALVEDVELAARSDAAVLISGESGTRKDALARLIHARSSRSRAAFSAIDCSNRPSMPAPWLRTPAATTGPRHAAALSSSTKSAD